MLTNLISIGVK